MLDFLLLFRRENRMALDPFRVLLHDRERMKLDLCIGCGQTFLRDRKSDRRTRRAVGFFDHSSWNDV